MGGGLARPELHARIERKPVALLATRGLPLTWPEDEMILGYGVVRGGRGDFFCAVIFSHQPSLTCEEYVFPGHHHLQHIRLFGQVGGTRLLSLTAGVRAGVHHRRQAGRPR